jgi:hypothetical protein
VDELLTSHMMDKTIKSLQILDGYQAWYIFEEVTMILIHTIGNDLFLNFVLKNTRKGYFLIRNSTFVLQSVYILSPESMVVVVVFPAVLVTVSTTSYNPE